MHELKAGLRVRGLVAAGDVTIVAVEPHGDAILNVVYRGDDGHIADRLLTFEDLGRIEVATGRRWSFDADGAAFKLASEARRIQLAHLFDPFAAVGSSTIPHYHVQAEELYFFQRGTGVLRMADEERSVRPGDCAVIPPGVEHQLTNTGNEDLVLLCCCAPAYSDEDTVLIDPLVAAG